MRFRPNLSGLHEQPTSATCDHEGCVAAGEFRAPKTRRQLREYYFFCLDHVREYNKNWNFCANMDTRAMEREIRNDTVWRRPTWPFNGHAKHAQYGFEDNLDILEDIIDFKDRAHARSANPVRHIDPAIAIAMQVMNLAAPLTLTALKSRYKDLVKRHHPDANNGDKSAEDRLKTINEAYATLKKFAAQSGL